MTRQATPTEVRKALQAEGYDVHIRKDGAVHVRKNRDRFPGARQVWTLRAYMNDFRFSYEVILP